MDWALVEKRFSFLFGSLGKTQDAKLVEGAGRGVEWKEQMSRPTGWRQAPDSARALSEGREDTPSICYRVQASAGQNTSRAGCGRHSPLLLGHRQPKVEVWLGAGDPWESGQGSSPTVEYFPC